MSLTLIKLHRATESQWWARTAQLAAEEAGDPAVQSWVRAQQAYTAYYAHDLDGAVEIARHSQALAGSACVGLALSAALEARAHALKSRPRETYEALAVAESTLDRLNGESVSASAFSYNETQYRFHEGNALTHLGDTAAALVSIERALQLYPPEDFLDRSLVRLDRAACLTRDGQADAAAAEVSATLGSLTYEQREGMIDIRARVVVGTMAGVGQPPSAVRDVRDILRVATTFGGGRT